MSGLADLELSMLINPPPIVDTMNMNMMVMMMIR